MYNNPDNFVPPPESTGCHHKEEKKRWSIVNVSDGGGGGRGRGRGGGRGGEGEGREGRWRERGWQTSELSLGSDLQSEESESDRLQGTFHA